MKKYIYYIFSLLFLTISACTGMEEFDETIPGDDAVIFSLRTTAGVVTRSEDTSVEEKMAKIDVFFVTEEGSVYYHEQVLNEKSDPVYKQGEFTLIKRRSEFTENAKYYVYVIANAKADISNVQSLDALQALTQEDDDLHLSGLVDGAPSLFLMDGFANITGAQSASPVAVVINDGVAQNKTYLTGVLRRAAAKIILNITQGDNVQFKERIPTEGVLLGEALYSFYQLPVSTLVLTPDGSSWHNSTKVTTDDQRINGKTFTWTYVDGKPHIQIIGYAYANDWGDTEITKETSMLLNIPMLWDHDNDDSTDPESRPNSWFKVPLSKENKFDRNTCYQINIKINAVGAQDKSSVIELQDIEYVTQDWITHTVTVGQNDSNPEYLMLNTDLVQIYNENVDATSLTFSSSSYIKSITLKDVYKQNSDGSFTKESDSHKAYYINKFGVTTELGSNIVSTISAVAEPGKLNGGITITSPIVPATQTEINQQIAALVKPVAPTVTPPVAPQEPEGKPVEPESVEEPIQPNPQNYVPNNTREYEYRYNTESKKFQRKSWWSNWPDIDDPESYTNALKDYQADLAAYNQYLTDYKAYQNALAQWMSTDEYKNYEPVLEAYNAELQAYEAVMNAYQTELDAYNAAIDAIKAAAEGEETHYDTIRYLEFEVINETGQTATFRVMQYPVIYVVNQQGYYSYRDDFIATDGTVVHYQNRKANYFTTAYWHGYRLRVQNGDSWSDVDNVTRYETIYKFGNNYYALSGNATVQIEDRYGPEFTKDGKVYRKYYNSLNDTPGVVFTSDVVRSVYTSGNNIGKANLVQYQIYDNRNGWNYSNSKDPGNQRMYHVRVTSTSGQYTVGRPRIIDDDGNLTNDVERGHTDDSEDNSLLVSPSFMIASQLGVTSPVSSASESNYERAVAQCKNYVETYFVDLDNDNQWDQGEEVIHYHDWRLPTAAEIAIIANLQGKQNGAVDVVLAGKNYFCASPSRSVPGLASGTNGYFIRCIRDAY